MPALLKLRDQKSLDLLKSYMSNSWQCVETLMTSMHFDLLIYHKSKSVILYKLHFRTGDVIRKQHNLVGHLLISYRKSPGNQATDFLFIQTYLVNFSDLSQNGEGTCRIILKNCPNTNYLVLPAIYHICRHNSVFRSNQNFKTYQCLRYYSSDDSQIKFLSFTLPLTAVELLVLSVNVSPLGFLNILIIIVRLLRSLLFPPSLGL